MCYNYSVNKAPGELKKRYKANFEKEEGFVPVFHTSGFTYSKLPVITSQDPGNIELFNWGLIPFWNKEKEKAFHGRTNTLNAKCETAFDKPSFRTSIKSKRCLVPATGFYEWMEYNKKKYPFFISLKRIEIFSFGGIWDECTIKNDNGELEVFRTFSILTTEANGLLSKIHNNKKRMPVIIHPGQEQLWLTNELKKEEVESLMLPFPEEEMTAHTISKLITSRKEDPNVPEVQEPFVYPELIY